MLSQVIKTKEDTVLTPQKILTEKYKIQYLDVIILASLFVAGDRVCHNTACSGLIPHATPTLRDHSR